MGGGAKKKNVWNNLKEDKFGWAGTSHNILFCNHVSHTVWA